MADDIKQDVIKKTQDSLGKYIKKPPLTDKLLKKPPFRFLHDIITNVIKDTGFLDGVFTPEELNHENVKDRDAKIQFLQKGIDALKAITGIPLSARPSKIVAGHEPAKTNEFLQAIGKALEKKLDSSDYVAKLSSKQEKPGRVKPANKDTKLEGNKVKSKVGPVKTNQRDKSKIRDSTKKKSVTSNALSEKSSKVSKESEHDETKKIEAESTFVSKTSNDDKASKVEDEQQSSASPHLPAPVAEPESLPEKRDPTPPKPLQPNSQKEENEYKDAAQAEASADLNSNSPKSNTHERKKKSAKNSDSQREVSNDAINPDYEQTETATPIEIGVFGSKLTANEVKQEVSSSPRVTTARPKTGRPASARPAAPRIRDRGEVEVQEEPRLATGKVNVITDNDSVKEQDEFENFEVEETPLIASLEQDTPNTSVLSAFGDHVQQGHLVAQILETQKELEIDNQFLSGDKEKSIKRVEIEWESGHKREKELASKEVDRLRSSIQTLTRAANPLGKLMDFLQEDVDAMQRELELWKSTNEQLQIQLVEEQSLTEESVKPMKMRLQQLHHAITERLDEISAFKAKILRNDLKIQKLVANGFSKKTYVFV